MAHTELHCQHQYYLTNHIHKLILQNSSKHAVDDALAHLKAILDDHPNNEQLKLLIDARAGVPPLQYFFTQLRKLYGSYEQLPQVRAAYIYEESVMLSALQMFFNALGMKASRRFIKGGTEIEAQNWLLSSDID
ncbi:MAG: hypothetical protein ACFE0Q_16030 [Anaerolineae bacterium]